MQLPDLLRLTSEYFKCLMVLFCTKIVSMNLVSICSDVTITFFAHYHREIFQE